MEVVRVLLDDARAYPHAEAGEVWLRAVKHLVWGNLEALKGEAADGKDREHVTGVK